MGMTNANTAAKMTRRDFNRLTQENWGEAGMASDERRDYRARRCQVDAGYDWLAYRAAEQARRNARGRVVVDGFLPTLSTASRWRNVAAHARAAGLPLLRVAAPALP